MTARSSQSSPDSDEDSDALYLKPAKKKTASSKPQATVTDFFDKVPSGAVAKKPTARKASGSKLVVSMAKAKVVDSDHDVEMVDDVAPAMAKRNAAPRRAARAAPKKYVEILSSEAEDGGVQDGSDFEDFD